ncbi:next to BRCA1 gene 1 protein isoform X5 [Stigmatopora argus]
MDFYINLKVNFRGNSKNFLLSGSETKSWDSMEAMVRPLSFATSAQFATGSFPTAVKPADVRVFVVKRIARPRNPNITVKRSFGLCSLQLTYFDEENEEVSINSQGEYEDALKSAARQGSRLHLNVYETRSQPPRISTGKAGGAEPKRGFRPPQHCPPLSQMVSRKVQALVPGQGMVIMKDVKGTKEEDKTPPAWFTSYMENFKDQVVREAVEKICREFSGQCCIHKPLSGIGGNRGDEIGSVALVPEVSSSILPGAASSSALSCSSCRGQTTGGGYQCSVCTSCTLCEPCSFAHDPSHNLVRARTPLSIPEHGSPAPDHSRFYRRGDRSFRKAEKQRLKAEKRLLKAEVKEIRKQLRLERYDIQWSSLQRNGRSSPVLLQPRATQHNSPEQPKRPCPLVVPTMTATFLDENLSDGTHLRPGTKFIKYWKMRNTGTMSWSLDTKLKFMWGNLAVGSGDRWREVPVPFLQPGQDESSTVGNLGAQLNSSPQRVLDAVATVFPRCRLSAWIPSVGIVSVTLSAPLVEGSYTSHWRLAHVGEQFGPRVWCSIVVDPQAPAPMMADGILVSPCATPQVKNHVLMDAKSSTASQEQSSLSVCSGEEFYIPSVDLLTAQDLLSFELLDINIVQELESVPNNTPAEVTSCISPLPQDVYALDKGSPTLELIQEETEVINGIMDAEAPYIYGVSVQCKTRQSEKKIDMKDSLKKQEKTKSRSSSTSSEEYIILPDCFDTSRPLGESIYSVQPSQPHRELYFWMKATESAVTSPEFCTLKHFWEIPPSAPLPQGFQTDRSD